MKINQKSNDLTYEDICAAVNGDYDAEEIILDYFEPYIIKLSKMPFIDKHNTMPFIHNLYVSTSDDTLAINVGLKNRIGNLFAR